MQAAMKQDVLREIEDQKRKIKELQKEHTRLQNEQAEVEKWLHWRQKILADAKQMLDRQPKHTVDMQQDSGRVELDGDAGTATQGGKRQREATPPPNTPGSAKAAKVSGSGTPAGKRHSRHAAGSGPAATPKQRIRSVAEAIRRDLDGAAPGTALTRPLQLNPDIEAKELHHVQPHALVARFEQSARPPSVVWVDVGVALDKGDEVTYMTSHAAEMRLELISNLNSKAEVDPVFVLDGCALRSVVKDDRLDAKRRPKGVVAGGVGAQANGEAQ
jgi:hypothetical protein